MARTVVGLFKNQQEAQNVKHDLVNEGYSAENIRLVANDGSVETSASTDKEATDTGFGATISNFFHSLTGGNPPESKQYAEGVSKGGAFLAVTVPDNRADAAAAVLERHGARDVNEQAGQALGKAPANAAQPGSDAGQTMAVVEEELQVGKRQVQHGGVRVYSHVTEQPVDENIELREEHVRVDRQRVDRPASEADFTAFREGSMELTEHAEEAVVSKTARVVEEVTFGKNVTERQETVKGTVRRSDVEVEQIAPERPNGGVNYQQYEPAFRKHYETNYAKSGSPYDRYAPAYQYGNKLANDPRYVNGDWASLESSASSDWSKQGRGSWEEMKGAVRHGWDQNYRRSATKAER